MHTRRAPRVLRSQHRCIDPVAFAVPRRPALAVVASAVITSLLLLLGQSCAAASALGRLRLGAKQQPPQQQLLVGGSSSSGIAKANHKTKLGGRLRQFRERFGGGGGGGCAKAEKAGVQIVGGTNGGGMAARALPPNGNGHGAEAKVNGYNSFIAGGLAGSIATTITCPIEV